MLSLYFCKNREQICIPMITIQNEHLSAAINPQGAETRSLRDLQTGREFLWQGDARWWTGCSPILFPITGGMWNGETLHSGRTLRIPKHGFAAKCTWTVREQTEDAVTFALRSDDAHVAGQYAEAFPFRYELRVTYRLCGRTLRADIAVENLDTQHIYFQVGGHPGIALPDWQDDVHLDGYLRFEGDARTLVRAGEQGCIEVAPDGTPIPFPVPATAEGLVPLCVETFAHEALIFCEQISAATVLDRDERPVARVASSAPVWLFWNPQGQHAPFVCCEPWYGLPDFQGFHGDISQRPYIQSAAPAETWKGWYTVEV